MRKRPPAPWTPPRRPTAVEQRNWRLIMTPLDKEPPKANEARVAPKGAASSYAKGMRAEAKAKAMLRDAGFTIVPNLGSRGAADIVALRARLDVDGPPVRTVQVKSLSMFAPSGLNQAVMRFLGLGKYAKGYGFDVADGSRESWLFIRGNGRLDLVAVATLDHANTLTVTGSKAKEVEASLKKMLANASQPKKNQRTLKQRLGIEE